jgi:hypothetical protein
MKHHTLLLPLLLTGFALNAYAQVIVKPLQPTNPPVIQSPLKKNVLSVDGKNYFIPGYLKLLKDSNGRFKVDPAFFDEHRVGNGGDYLRSQFISIGTQVIRYLETTLDGQNLTQQRGLDITTLKNTLDINKLIVVDEILIDNTGSVVDSIGVPDLIILNAESWNNHYEKKRSIYYLVFHEMLRSAATNDDNFVISQSLMSFPTDLQINTQLVSAPPLLAEDNISALVKAENLAIGGTGCTAKTGRQFLDLDLISNKIELSLYDYTTQLNGTAAFDRKSCNVALPLSIPAGRRLVISLIDLQGQVNGSTASPNTAQVSLEAFLAGSSQPVLTKALNLNSGTKSFLMRKTNILATTCGGDTMLRLNSNVIMRRGAKASSGSADMVQIKKVSIYLSLETCTK